MDKREKMEQVNRTKQEDAILNRVLVWIAGAVVLEALLLLLNRFYVEANAGEAGIAIMVGIKIAIQILAIAFPVCFVVCIAWVVMSKRSGKKSGLPMILCAIAGVLSVCVLTVWFFYGSGIRLLYILVPVMAVMALVYYLYQREFFVVTALSAGGIFGVWLIQRGTRDTLLYGYFAVLAVVLLAVVIVGRMLQAKGGALKLGGKTYQVLPPNANYIMLYVTCGIEALAILAGLLIPVAVAVIYAVVVAWLLIMAVYYTVRLM